MSHSQYADPAAAAILSKYTFNGQDVIAAPRTFTGRPSFSSWRQKSTTRSQRSFSGSNGDMISSEEYEALPASIKKKYFSSSERLHIAQESAVQKRRKHSFGSASWISGSTSTDAELRPSTSQGISLRKRASQRQTKDSTSPFAGLDLDNISEEQARWFVNLPDKIRKQQFSRKEQISLAVRCKRVLQYASPELADDVLRRCLYAGRGIDAVSVTNRRRRRSSATVDTDILINEDLADYDALSRGSFDALAPEMEIYNIPTAPPTSEGEDGAFIPAAEVLPLQESPPRHRQSRSRSLSRGATFAPVSFPFDEVSAVPPVPPLPPPDQLPLARPRELSTLPTRPQYAEPNLVRQDSTTEVKSYQPHDVRKQLRQYLSPQKFDEALEFGFAFSKEERAPPSSSATNQSFPLQAPAPCFTEDDYVDDDANDSPETLSPRTPTAPDTAHPAIKKPSFDSSIEIRPNLFTALKTNKRRNRGDSFGNREMTIHMTLTRRDLRAPDEDGYGVQRPTTSGVDVERVDPLALDILPVCDDPTGAHGAFAVRDSKGTKGFKKVWKSLIGH